jgi:hypothetical protein
MRKRVVAFTSTLDEAIRVDNLSLESARAVERPIPKGSSPQRSRGSQESQSLESCGFGFPTASRASIVR